MARFTGGVNVAASVDQVWARITDWPAHGRWIPFTTVRLTGDRPDGVGAGFVGRTGFGPISFDDSMRIVEWCPPVAGRPGHCRVEKCGRVVLGWAAFDVLSAPEGGTAVRWTEEVRLAPVRLTWPADGLIARAGRFGLARVLRSMARELESQVGSND